MDRARSARWIAGVSFMLVAAAGIRPAATAAPAAQSPDSDSHLLLEEVRALRADLHQAAGASIRAQLLVVRLQLQEQRIVVLNGQLADVRRQISEKESAAFPMSENVKRLQDTVQNAGARDPNEQRDIETALSMSKASLAQVQREIAQLRAQEGELLGAITAEQNRWSDFNSRLDDLERQLPPR